MYCESVLRGSDWCIALERIMFLDFVHCLIFLKTTFQKLDLFPPSGKIMAVPSVLGPLERARSKTYKHLRSGSMDRK
jgi:hypothetical protein